MLTVVPAALTRAAEMIQEENGAAFTSNAFDRFQAALLFPSNRKSTTDRARAAASATNARLWQLTTLVLRLNYERAQWVRGDLPDGLWRPFAECDIRLYHVELRSLLDHVAECMNWIAPKPGQIDESFTTLYEKLPKYESRLGPGLAGLVRRCTWYPYMQEMRDDITHSSPLTLVFPIPGRITFQVYAPGRGPRVLPGFMYNDAIIDFEKYAAMQMANVFCLLDDLGQIGLASLPAAGPQSRNQHSGYGVLRAWILSLLSPATVTGPSGEVH